MDTVFETHGGIKERIDIYDITTCGFVISLFVFENARFALIYSAFQAGFFAVSLYYMCRKNLYVNSAIKWAGILLLYIIVINMLYSFDDMNGIRTAIRNILRMVCFVQYAHNKNYKRLLQFVLVGGLLSGFFLLSEIRTTGLVSTDIRYVYQNRIGADIAGGNQNITAMNMCLAFLCAFPLYQMENEKKKRALIVFLAAIIAISSMLTGARKTLICYIFALMLYIIIEKNGRIKKIAILLILLSTSYYLLISIPELYYTIGYRFDRNIGVFFSSQGSDDIRASLIKKGMQLFSEKPILGVGFGNVEKMIGNYTHCNYTEILASGGILGMVIYYSSHIRSLVISIKCKSELKTSLIIMIATLLLLDVTQITYLFSVFWIFSALVFSAQKNKSFIYSER